MRADVAQLIRNGRGGLTPHQIRRAFGLRTNRSLGAHFSRAIPRKPSRRINRPTVHRATGVPDRFSSAWTFRAPWTPRPTRCEARMFPASRSARAHDGPFSRRTRHSGRSAHQRLSTPYRTAQPRTGRGADRCSRPTSPRAPLPDPAVELRGREKTAELDRHGSRLVSRGAVLPGRATVSAFF